MNRPDSPARLAILISGAGSNLQAFIDACSSGTLPATIAVVISNKADAPGLARAREAGIPTRVVDHRQFDGREAFDAALVEELAHHQVDLVLLAGFMRILTATFVAPYLGRLLNIHPSLLPKYPGLNTHQRALDAGDFEAGTTVHFVTLELDGGPPVLQAAERIAAEDTAEQLALRVQRLEHKIYPLAARWFLENRLCLEGEKALLDGSPLPPEGARFTAELA